MSAESDQTDHSEEEEEEEDCDTSANKGYPAEIFEDDVSLLKCPICLNVANEIVEPLPARSPVAGEMICGHVYCLSKRFVSWFNVLFIMFNHVLAISFSSSSRLLSTDGGLWQLLSFFLADVARVEEEDDDDDNAVSLLSFSFVFPFVCSLSDSDPLIVALCAARLFSVMKTQADPSMLPAMHKGVKL